MRYVSLFSGIEAASVAWAPLGWTPAAFAEVDAFPSAVLAERFPDVPNLGDVTGVDWSGYAGAVDLIVGGSPCQSFSVAGKREGLDGASGLMFEWLRAVRDVRPRWVVWENVPGVFSIDGGRAFATLLDELAKLGYDCAWRVLDAQFFGVAQRRRRVFLIGRLGGGGRAPAVLFECESVRGGAITRTEKRAQLARAAGKGAGGCYAIAGNIIGRKPGAGGNGDGWSDDGSSYTQTVADRHVICVADNTSKAAVDDELCGTLKCAGATPFIGFTYNAGAAVSMPFGNNIQPTLTVKNSNCATVCHKSTVRRLTPKECERLQGFPDDWTRIPWRGKPASECSDAPRYKVLGNSMAVPVMRWIGERIGLVDAL